MKKSTGSFCGDSDARVVGVLMTAVLVVLLLAALMIAPFCKLGASLPPPVTHQLVAAANQAPFKRGRVVCSSQTRLSAATPSLLAFYTLPKCAGSKVRSLDN